MALGTIATIATIAGAAMSVAGTAYAATQDGPKLPDGASSSRKVANAQAKALPSQLRLQQLQQQGGKGKVQMPGTQKQMPYAKVQTGWKVAKGKSIRNQFLGGIAQREKTYENVPYVKSEWEPGGKYAGKGKPEVIWKTVDIPAGEQDMDFTGYGTADIEGDLARRQADLEIELGKKYGTQFADSARELQEQADPLGTKARAMEFELMQKKAPISPLSGMLDEQIRGEVGAGRGLDPMSRDLLDASIAKANAARGDQVGAGDVTRSMSTGAEGEARLNKALTKSGAFMSSGQTPEDLEFRRDQQEISNMGAFVNGQTPQSQFGNLAAAGHGATPNSGAQSPVGMPNNAGGVGQGYATAGYAANTQQAMQPNSWFTGMGAVLNGLGALKMGKG